jgi:hypothetical protein
LQEEAPNNYVLQISDRHSKMHPVPSQNGMADTLRKGTLRNRFALAALLPDRSLTLESIDNIRKKEY